MFPFKFILSPLRENLRPFSLTLKEQHSKQSLKIPDFKKEYRNESPADEKNKRTFFSAINIFNDVKGDCMFHILLVKSYW